jgi:ATP:ADP antiporter, AAA family
MPEAAEEKKSVLEQLLSIVTIAKPGEGATAILMALNIFVLLAAYYILKNVREATISTQQANYGAAIMALLLIPTVKAYGAIAARVARKKLISYVTAFFIANLVIFYMLYETEFHNREIIFFIWVGIFNNMVIAQFWSYGNDIYNPEQGKRLFPLIVLGSSMGAIVGPLAGGRLKNLLGINPLLLVAGGMLALCIILTIWIDNREKPGFSKQTQKSKSDEVLGREGGFELVWRHRYLLYIALLIIALNVINTTGEQIRRETFNTHAQMEALAQTGARTDSKATADAIRNIKFDLNSDFLFKVNLLTVFIQTLLVSRILKWLGIRGALLLVPVVVLLGYGMMALLPVLWVVRDVKILENSQDYSLMNTLRAALYLPTTREMKYKAKQVIDTFFVRLGDLVAAGIWYIGYEKFSLKVGGFARLMLGFIVLWLVLAFLIRREHRKLVPAERASGAPDALVASSS